MRNFVHRPALTLFLLALTVRLLILSSFATSPFFLPESDDMKFYSDWGLRISRGLFTDGEAFYGLPGYAFILGAIYSLCGFDPFIVGAIQAVLDALTAVVLLKIAKVIFSETSLEAVGFRLDRGVVIGFGAGLLWTFYQPAQGFCVILMPSAWCVLAFWASVWWSVKTDVSTPCRPWLWLGLGVGLVSTVVATVLCVVGLFAIAITVSVSRGEKHSLRVRGILAAMTLLFCGLGIGMFPAWGHNYFIAKEPVLLSAHSGINFWVGNSPVANGYAKIPPGLRASQEGLLKDSLAIAQVEAGRPLKRYEVSKWWSDKAKAQIQEHPTWWLRLLAVKVHNFWNAFQYDDLAILKLLTDHSVLLPGLRFGVIAAFGLPGLFLAGWRFPKAWWVAGAILLHLAMLLPVFVTERYRLAAVPGLLILGAYFVWHLWNAFVHRLWQRLGISLALFLGAAVFVSQPQRELGLWSLDYYKAGIRATDAGEYGPAMSNLLISQAYSPDSSDIAFAIGNVWLGQGGRSEAKRYYRYALKLNPNHERVLNNIGVLALEEKFYELAEQCFLGALKTEPDDEKMLYLLALTRVESGNKLGAEAPLRRAMELRPSQSEFLKLSERIRNP